MAFITPQSLFGKTLATIAVVSAVFLTFTLAVVANFLLFPIGERSAVDITELMASSVERWAEMPPEQRPAFAERLERRTGVRLRPVQAELPERGVVLPYFYFVEAALAERLGRPVTLRVDEQPGAPPYYFVTLQSGAVALDAGIAHTHVGVQPPLALLLVLSVGFLVATATAVMLVRRLTAPLERLSAAARRLGGGQWPEPLPESGPAELVEVTRSFNRMALQVQELLANRTTLLAGISHDLRTPLARMQVALEMLPESEPELLSGIRDDLTQMNALIGQFLEVARGLDDDPGVALDLAAVLEEIADSVRRSGADVTLHRGAACRLTAPLLALRRVLENLTENAVRYGAGHPVEIARHCDTSRVEVQVMDRGPGIPADKTEAVFRPFYRLEGSRSRNTGGSGLGLSIARQLAQANGWTIELLPRHGGGTRAVLSMPVEGARRERGEHGDAEFAE